MLYFKYEASRSTTDTKLNVIYNKQLNWISPYQVMATILNLNHHLNAEASRNECQMYCRQTKQGHKSRRFQTSKAIAPWLQRLANDQISQPPEHVLKELNAKN